MNPVPQALPIWLVWLRQTANLRLWFWFVVVVGLVPVIVRVFRSPDPKLLNGTGTGELFVVGTIVSGAAIERSFGWLRDSANNQKEIRRILMWEFVAVNIVAAILASIAYSAIDDKSATYDVAVESWIFWLFSMVLGGIVVILDDR